MTISSANHSDILEGVEMIRSLGLDELKKVELITQEDDTLIDIDKSKEDEKEGLLVRLRPVQWSSFFL